MKKGNRVLFDALDHILAEDLTAPAVAATGTAAQSRGNTAAANTPAGKVLLARLGKMTVWSLPGKPGGARAAFEEIVLPYLRERFHR